ncbi:hypothetical protein QUF74_04140 [Candidatus Halobeggiatoa sp. HSG11]|nr:hypothetical protein [Candidatus Halobeggiatoa sp. HSG11]
MREETITLIDLALPSDLATGKYCIYGILAPKDESIFEVKEQWIMDMECFKLSESDF